ncbi:MAG: NAD(P)(+) transhydrogenase (Re/Si-specific) subunit beta [Halothiobacillaceae bacterium]
MTPQMNAFDLFGWFGLVAVLGGLFLLKRHGGGMGGLLLMLGAMLGMVGAVLWHHDFRNALLVVSMVVLGVALAPWFSGRRRGVLSGVALINASLGLAIALLGLVGLVEGDAANEGWDTRLSSVLGLVLGVWTFASGLMVWLRLTDHLPESVPTPMQQRVQWVILAVTLALGLAAVVWPNYATFPLVLMLVLTLELGALSALGVRVEGLAAVMARHVGFVGAALAMLGYVHGSLFLIALGLLAFTGAWIFQRGIVIFRSDPAPVSVDTEAGHRASRTEGGAP